MNNDANFLQCSAGATVYAQPLSMKAFTQKRFCFHRTRVESHRSNRKPQQHSYSQSIPTRHTIFVRSTTDINENMGVFMLSARICYGFNSETY